MSVLWAPRRLGVALSASARRGGALADFQRLWWCFLARFGRLLAWARRGGAIVNFEAVLSDIFVFYGFFSDLVNSCRDCCFTYFFENFKFLFFLDVDVFHRFQVQLFLRRSSGPRDRRRERRHEVFRQSVANKIVPLSEKGPQGRPFRGPHALRCFRDLGRKTSLFGPSSTSRPAGTRP